MSNALPDAAVVAEGAAAAPPHAPPDAAVVAEGAELLRTRARSFRLASVLLGPAQAADAALCYGFCRVADDAVDDAPTLADARVAIDALRAELRGDAPARPLVAGWLALVDRLGVPRAAGADLLDTLAEDVGAVRLHDDDALRRYAYGVAGTVGLMMCGVLGATDPRARPAAVDLGIAMQITNICRDIAEDAGRDRVYLPATRLRAAGIDPADVAAGRADPAALFRVVQGLLALAETYYASGRDGLRFLPWRSRAAGLVALHLYRGIGRAILARGPDALRVRTVVGTAGRTVLFVRALLDLVVLGVTPSPALSPNPRA